MGSDQIAAVTANDTENVFTLTQPHTLDCGALCISSTIPF